MRTFLFFNITLIQHGSLEREAFFDNGAFRIVSLKDNEHGWGKLSLFFENIDIDEILKWDI